MYENGSLSTTIIFQFIPPKQRQIIHLLGLCSHSRWNNLLKINFCEDTTLTECLFYRYFSMMFYGAWLVVRRGSAWYLAIYHSKIFIHKVHFHHTTGMKGKVWKCPVRMMSKWDRGDLLQNILNQNMNTWIFLQIDVKITPANNKLGMLKEFFCCSKTRND